VLDKILSDLFGSLSKKQIKLNNSKLIKQKKVCYMQYVYSKRERERERGGGEKKKEGEWKLRAQRLFAGLLWSFIISWWGSIDRASRKTRLQPRRIFTERKVSMSALNSSITPLHLPFRQMLSLHHIYLPPTSSKI